MASNAVKPLWMKHDTKIKDGEKDAAAKDATFKGSDQPRPLIGPPPSSTVPESSPEPDRDSDDESDYLSKKPIGPVDPRKSTASGAGIVGGGAWAPSKFIVTTKDSDGRKVTHGGALIRVKVSPGVGVGGTDQEGVVTDIGDGCYAVSYLVPKLGNYTVSIECNGVAIMGSPFPVFFSHGQAATTSTPSAAVMAVARPIVAKALQAHTSQMQAQAPSNKGSLEYGKTKEATTGLAVNNMEACGRPLNVEIARSLPGKPSSNNPCPFALPMMMQQAIATQQAANRAATELAAAARAATELAAARAATEVAAARAAEISRKLNSDQKPRRRLRSPSYSPPPPFRPSHRRSTYEGRRLSYRDSRYIPESRRYGRSDEHHSSSSGRSRSVSPKKRKSKQDDSELLRHRQHSSSPGDKKSSRAGSRSPRLDKETKSTRRDDEATKHKRQELKHRSGRRSSSVSSEGRHRRERRSRRSRSREKRNSSRDKRQRRRS